MIARLKAYGEEQRKLHHRFVRSQDLKQATSHLDSTDECHWQARARTHLYRSKRALSLSEMLRARRVLKETLGQHPTAEGVRALLEYTEGRQIAKRVLRKAKADRVGTAMADITVCGAVAPYSLILGGKLVSMLIASPDVVVAYRSRYLNQQSEIASAMAGRPIVRPSQVVLFGTTSLYGAGSSQYNRLRMPAEMLGGRPGEYLEYIELGKSEAYGTSHFSMDTVEALVALVQQTSNGQRVNSIFGEGVNPKLRKMREGWTCSDSPPTNCFSMVDNASCTRCRLCGTPRSSCSGWMTSLTTCSIWQCRNKVRERSFDGGPNAGCPGES